MHPADEWLSEGAARPLLLDGRLLGATNGGRHAVVEPARGTPPATVADAVAAAARADRGDGAQREG